MKPPQARVFLEGVVLGLVRADLEQPSTRKDTRRLSPHLYEALKRALYKPAAFFKGIVFPMLDVSTARISFLSLVLPTFGRFAGSDRLCVQGGCTLKEAAIIASVLAKVKVPLLHSSAALIRLAGMEYSGTPSTHSAAPIPPYTRTRTVPRALQQDRPRSSSAFCWTRSTRCHTRCSTRSSSTSSGYPTRIHPACYPFSGTRACSCSASATRRISRQSKKTRCVTSCASTRMRRLRPRLDASLQRYLPGANDQRQRLQTRWMFRSSKPKST